MPRPRGLRSVLVVAAFIGWATASPASGQLILDSRQTISFDRPESWAMKYFASASLPATVSTRQPLEAGDWELSLEYAQIPSLNEQQRQVGFNGTKTEDLNRIGFLLRPAARVGVGKQVTLSASYLPPVEVDGVEPHILTLALARPLHQAGRWRLGLGLLGQIGRTQGDLTCSAEQAAAGNDPVANPFECEAPSNDEHRFRTIGLELGSSWQLGEQDAWTPYVALTLRYMDLEFQVDAVYAGLVDKTHLSTDGSAWSGVGGVGYRFSQRWSATVEVFYSPLEVVRPPSTTKQTDELLSVRAVVTYAF